MMMCKRNYGNEAWEDTSVRGDGIDLKKVRAAMRCDPEGMYQSLTVLLGEARAVRDDPAFRFPDEEAEMEDTIEPGFSKDMCSDDLMHGLTALHNGEMTPAEKEAFIYELAEAIVKCGRERNVFSLPFPGANAGPAAVKPKSKPSKKKQ